LRRITFTPWVSAWEKARKGSRPQYKKRPKFSALSPVTSLNLIPSTSEKIAVNKTTIINGPKNAQSNPKCEWRYFEAISLCTKYVTNHRRS
jgi:hypothetical protein